MLFLCDLELEDVIRAALESEDAPIEQLLAQMGMAAADPDSVQIQLRQHAGCFRCMACDWWVVEPWHRDSEMCQECDDNSCQECGDTLFADGLCVGCHTEQSL